MRRPSLLRRLAAAATGLWLVASSSVSPLLACEAHGGMRGHAHGPAAVTEASAPAGGAHHEGAHHDAATLHDVAPVAHASHGASEPAHGGHAHVEHGEHAHAEHGEHAPAAHRGHGEHATTEMSPVAVAADASPEARDHDGDEGAPCTCAGSCCPSALVAVPGLAVAVAHATLVEVAVAATVAPTPVVPETAPQRRQPPATPPPVRTLS